MEIVLNEIIISGTINNVTDNKKNKISNNITQNINLISLNLDNKKTCNLFTSHTNNDNKTPT